MALVRRAAWSAVGGYRNMKVMGWEDFEMWCRFIEHGFWAAWVPEPLAGYRVHSKSMIQTLKNEAEKQHQLIGEIHELHPWLDLASLRQTWAEKPRGGNEQIAHESEKEVEFEREPLRHRATPPQAPAFGGNHPTAAMPSQREQAAHGIGAGARRGGWQPPLADQTWPPHFLRVA